VSAGCEEESGKHQHTTYHTRPSFRYILHLKGSRTSCDPTDDASTNAHSHSHNAYVQYVKHPSLSYFLIVFGVFAHRAIGGVVKGRLMKREVLLG